LKYKEAFFAKRRFTSDKWDHYFEIYDHLLNRFYERTVTYVEIGVQNGGSLEIARKLFDIRSKIIGMDIDPACKALELSDIKAEIIIGSQSDETCLRSLISVADPIDILIDDGSHTQFDMINTFIHLWPHIKNDGVYIIEDTHTNYSPDHQKSWFGIGLYDYFKGLSERLNLSFINPDYRKTRYKLPRDQREVTEDIDQFHAAIFSIEFFNSVIAIKKKPQLEPLRTRL